MPGSISSKAKVTGSNDTGLWETARRFWQRSYAGDYLGVAILIAGFVVLKLFGQPFHSQFRLDDPRLQHPHAEVERVDIVWLLIYAGLLPLAILLVWAALIRPSPHQLHVTILGLVISILTTTFITDIIKDAVGRPRPDLIARCKPAQGTPRDAMISVEVCTEQNHHVLHDGWRSYPSGHSSFAFAGLGWIALLLASQLHVLRPRASLVVVLACLAPLMGAALIAVSRLEDYRHDVFDVVCGSLLGFAVTYGNWRRYYPSLMASGCEEPYELVQGNGMGGSGGFQRVRDEEQGVGREVDRYAIGDD
ncbi:putative phosphatidic acid phosphatase type 2/haloperoxidase [Septoria linicola]|nr:putative phosphatidic acid phosphatase type 2/haloperoxidase [Septoria linicola]